MLGSIVALVMAESITMHSVFVSQMRHLLTSMYIFDKEI